ncbi:Os06g0273400 [Oryza sativa Japonica Group]|uniref:Os06g0273400 protein n=1 Tax=Oryza sativa subsp. japonica TaxID=39947 RepID=Q5VN16_ORYSJ|nr:unknown protein [Oryza sativa Japonica Group]BAD69159.1 unknown protein [Oryza sativa Japonica Group]BAH93438.1 Os06g0273400 [Oryza sativa Japonica Group]|eukprot:NP_001174710.1 Os06g0273400 [Oryza sativa Japonica Group]
MCENVFVVTLERRHRRDCIWFLESESPTNAMDLPLRRSRNAAASNRGSSQRSGRHRHRRKPRSGRPYFMQFWCSWISPQVAFV